MKQCQLISRRERKRRSSASFYQKTEVPPSQPRVYDDDFPGALSSPRALTPLSKRKHSSTWAFICSARLAQLPWKSTHWCHWKCSFRGSGVGRPARTYCTTGTPRPDPPQRSKEWMLDRSRQPSHEVKLLPPSTKEPISRVVLSQNF